MGAALKISLHSNNNINLQGNSLSEYLPRFTTDDLFFVMTLPKEKKNLIFPVSPRIRDFHGNEENNLEVYLKVDLSS